MRLWWIGPLWDLKKKPSEFREENFWAQEFPLKDFNYVDKENIFVIGMFENAFEIYFSINISYFMKYVNKHILLYG